MRTIGSALVATTLLVTSAFAATDSVAPSASNGALAPGKPAGVQKAQGADNTIWWVLGAASSSAASCWSRPATAATRRPSRPT